MANTPVGAESAQAQDAAFWEAHRELMALEAAWKADPDKSDENWERHAGPVHAAFDKAMCIGVFTAKAVLAKYVATASGATDISGPAENTQRMIQWDLERLAGREMFGCACGGET